MKSEEKPQKVTVLKDLAVLRVLQTYSWKCCRKRCTSSRDICSLETIVKQSRAKNLWELHKEQTEAGGRWASRATTFVVLVLMTKTTNGWKYFTLCVMKQQLMKSVCIHRFFLELARRRHQISRGLISLCSTRSSIRTFLCGHGSLWLQRRACCRVTDNLAALTCSARWCTTCCPFCWPGRERDPTGRCSSPTPERPATTRDSVSSRSQNSPTANRRS